MENVVFFVAISLSKRMPGGGEHTACSVRTRGRRRTQFLEFRQSLVHASSQLCPLCELVLGTCREQFRLGAHELGFEVPQSGVGIRVEQS